MGVFATFTAGFCGGLLHFCFFCHFWGRAGDPSQLHFYWFCFLQSCAWHCASVTLVICKIMAPTLQNTYTGFSPLLFLHERPRNMMCTSPWCPTPLKFSCPSLHIWSSLWFAVLSAALTETAHCFCVCIEFTSIFTYVYAFSFFINSPSFLIILSQWRRGDRPWYEGVEEGPD